MSLLTAAHTTALMMSAKLEGHKDSKDTKAYKVIKASKVFKERRGVKV